MDNQKLKNYTSSVPAITSISRIENMLMEMGALNIAKEIENQKVKSIAFELLIKNGTPPLYFKLEAKVENVTNILKKSNSKLKNDAIVLQAERTAWKICYDWLTIQKAMLQLKQAEPLQLFLPYLYDSYNNKTFAETIIDNPAGLLMLTGKNNN